MESLLGMQPIKTNQTPAVGTSSLLLASVGGSPAPRALRAKGKAVGGGGGSRGGGGTEARLLCELELSHAMLNTHTHILLHVVKTCRSRTPHLQRLL